MGWPSDGVHIIGAIVGRSKSVIAWLEVWNSLSSLGTCARKRAHVYFCAS
jgi:hypothetical protein